MRPNPSIPGVCSPYPPPDGLRAALRRNHNAVINTFCVALSGMSLGMWSAPARLGHVAWAVFFTAAAYPLAAICGRTWRAYATVAGCVVAVIANAAWALS